MTDSYLAPEPSEPNVNINVTQAAPVAAPAPPRPAMATRDEVASFLGAATPNAPGGGVPGTYQQDPQGGGFVSGALKGASREVLGLLSLLPGSGDLFTRQGYLGQMAYAPARRGSEALGIGVGTIAPWLFGGEFLAGSRAIGALSELSPSIARAVTGAERLKPVTTEAGTVGGGIVRAKPSIARGAAVGAVAGAAQEPAGDTGYLARVAPAAGGALSAGALTALGLGAGQQRTVQVITTGLAGLLSYEGGGVGLAALAMYLVHKAGLGVRAAEHLGPHIAREARRLAGQSSAGVVGAEAGQVVNEVGQRT